MAIEKFGWQVTNEGGPKVSFRVRSTSFGDGYTQVAEDGINTRAVAHSATVKGELSVIQSVMDFFDRHGGYKAFEYEYPATGVGLYRCESYTPKPLGGSLWSISFDLIPLNRS